MNKKPSINSNTNTTKKVDSKTISEDFKKYEDKTLKKIKDGKQIILIHKLNF